MGGFSTKRQLMNCEVWKNAKPTAKVYVRRHKGMAIYQAAYLSRWYGRYADDLDIVAKNAGVHDLPSMTIKVLAIEGMTKDEVEKCSLFVESAFSAEIRADERPIEDVKMLGDDILLITT